MCFYRLSIDGVVCLLYGFAQLFWVNLCIYTYNCSGQAKFDSGMRNRLKSSASRKLLIPKFWYNYSKKIMKNFGKTGCSCKIFQKYGSVEEFLENFE